MRQHTGTALQLSPIARKQRALAGFGFLGAAGASVYSGPPVGEGAGKGAETGAVQGASLGTTIMPGIGTAIGAVVGAIGGAIAGAIGKKDPEQYSFEGAVSLWQQNRLAILNLANKYLPLAGLFDANLKGAHIPIYQKYGRMGEEKFTYDLATLIYNAAQDGKITAADTPQTVMTNVVQPWIDSFGFGPMQDPHADLINLLILGMIMDYVTGAAPQVWRSVSGPLPASFSRIPPFQLPGAAPAAVSNAANVAPGTAVSSAPISAITTPASTTASSNTAALPQFPGWSSATLPSDPRLTVPWTETENGYTTTLTPVAASNNLYTTTYPDGAAQFQWALSGNQVVGLRKSPNGWGKYTGTIGADGVSVSGTVTMTTTDHPTGWTYPFSAVISGTGTAPGTSTVTSVGSSSVSVPAGFTLVGSANGLQAYLGPDGLYYSWSGTNMSPLTGTLVGLNGNAASVISGQIQSAPVPSTAQSTVQTYVPPTYAASAPVYNSYAAPAQPAPAATATAALSGVPTWAWLGIGAGAVYLLMGRRGRA